MRVKVVPPVPESLERLREARAAVPRVPRPEDDCCTRVIDAGVADARDEAKEWLTFCRALGLVERGERGYRRAGEFDADRLPERFRERTFGAREVLAALEAGAETPMEVFEAVRERVPEWERRHHDDFEPVWRERVERLLGWAVLFGLADRDGDRYEPA